MGEAGPMGARADHLPAIRAAVAAVLRRGGMAEQAERTLRGEMDHLPMMQAAAGAVEAVLRGMFE